MPKLLLINNYHYRRGGADVVYLEQARLFRKMGWEVAEFSMNHPKNEASDYQDYFAEEIELGEAYPLATKLRHAAKIIFSFEAQRQLKRLIEDFKPDIVHAHNVYHHLSPSVLKAVNDKGIPLVMTVHDLKLLCPAYSMLSHGKVCEACHQGRSALLKQRCMKNSLALSGLIYLESSIHAALDIYRKHVDRFISPSQFFVDKFAQWGWDTQQFEYVRNFADAGDLYPQYAPGDYFLYFGRLSTEKGLTTLVNAAAQAGVKLKIVGGGPLEAELKTMAAELAADITFCGFQKGEALWDFVRGCRAIVLPSECYENAPLTILEAYACGKPALGARIGGIPELIREGETGAIFESGNVADLAKVLRQYADLNEASLIKQGQAARQWLEQDFSIERHIGRLLEVYRALGVAC